MRTHPDCNQIFSMMRINTSLVHFHFFFLVIVGLFKLDPSLAAFHSRCFSAGNSTISRSLYHGHDTQCRRISY